MPFGEELVHYAIGPASCAVPGVAAGLRELSRAHGRMPLRGARRAGASQLAREGVADAAARTPPASTMLEPVMTYAARGAALYAPGGTLLGDGDLLRQPGLADALQLTPEELDAALLALSDERGGVLTQEDLAAYRPLWREPAALDYCGTRLLARAGLAPILPVLGALPRLRDVTPAERVVALVRALAGDGPETHTTNLVAVDRDGNGCAITTSLGLGSGDFLPGLDLHLNSMLGETDLAARPARARRADGEHDGADARRSRTASSSSPAAPPAARACAPRSSPSSRGSSTRASTRRRRSIGRASIPRAHVVHAEPGVDEDGLAALEADGLRRCAAGPAQHHYFGGASVVSAAGAAADPRRSGLALVSRDRHPADVPAARAAGVRAR